MYSLLTEETRAVGMGPDEWRPRQKIPCFGKDTIRKAEMQEITVAFKCETGPQPVNEDLLNMVKILSHDVRGPLVTIMVALKLLRKGAYGKMDKGVSEELDNMTKIVLKNIGTLENFLGRALSLNSGLDSPRGRLFLKRDVLDPVMDEFSRDFEKTGTTIENRISSMSLGDFPIQGNAFLLRSVFRNLIKNAINHGDRNCRVVIDLNDHGPAIGIDVFNSGRPIPQESRGKLFRKFNNIERGSCGIPEGMGLGLYLVREILISHGGDIRYEAARDGSHFIFTLPCLGKDVPSINRSCP